MRLLSLALLLLAPAASRPAPPCYDDRADLLFYLDERGEKQPVRTPRDWQVRAGHTRAGMELVMGPLPQKSTEPLAVEVKAETSLRHYTRRHVWFTAEKGDRVPAWLLVPHHRPGKLPAVVCLPQTVASGKDEPAGLTANASLAYAHELAERGYVCVVPDYPLVHTREYRTDPYRLGYASATMKGVVNHRRAIDLLESLPFVNRGAIAAVGHSLGGHNALFLAAFEPRVRAVVSSCGFGTFAKHNKGDVRAWSGRAYMPRIRTAYGDDPKKIPFDFTEVLAALAPRPVFVNAPLHDGPDFEVSGVRDCVAAALPVYRRVFDAADRLVVHHPDAGHAFPLEQRLAAYDFLDRHLRPRAKGPGLGRGLVAHWPAEGAPGDFAPKPLKPGTGDFSAALWVQSGPDQWGDLLSQYDPARRRGWHLTLKTSLGVTTSQPNLRQLQFGIDDGRASEFRGCGRPGDALLPFCLVAHAGRLYTSTCEAGEKGAGRVFCYGGGRHWIDCAIPARSNAVTAMAVHRGALYAAAGRYNTAGSALPPAKNQVPGGRVWRYEDNGRWADCGRLPDADAVAGLVSFRGRLYASALYRPAGFFRHEGGTKWTALPTPGGKRVSALAVFGDRLYATSYDGGHVYRFDGEAWADLGRLGQSTQTYSFAVHAGRPHVGTWPEGRVYRLDPGDRWADGGRLGGEKEVMGMLVHNGLLYAGTLPLAEVYRMDAPRGWARVGRLDHTPDVTYRRAWSMAEYQGQLFAGTLPSGEVFSFEAGRSVAWDHELPAGRHHVAAVKEGGVLRLYVDGRLAAASAPFDPAHFDLATEQPLKVGAGSGEPFAGRLGDVRVYDRALLPDEIAGLAGRR